MKTNKKLSFEETLNFIVDTFQKEFKIVDTKYEPNDSFDYNLENETITFGINNLTLKGKLDGIKYNLAKGEFPEFYLLLRINNTEFELIPNIKLNRIDGLKNSIEISLPESFIESERLRDVACEIAEQNYYDQAAYRAEERMEMKRELSF